MDIDYVSWVQELTPPVIADAASSEARFVDLQGIANTIAQDAGHGPYSPMSHAVLNALYDFVLALRPYRHDGGFLFRLSLDDEPRLLNPYDHWLAVQSLPLTPNQLTVLGAINEFSIVDEGTYYSRIEVEQDQVIAHLAANGTTLTPAAYHQIANSLEDLGLIDANGGLNYFRANANYNGIVRLSRVQVATDAEIDQLRFSGEGEELDFKRTIGIGSPTEKRSFVKDVVAFANASGTADRRILVGVEDDGLFHQPADPIVHQATLTALQETTLQQIVNSYSSPAPAVRIANRGTHRDGPYVVIAIERHIEHLPYRFFADTNTRHDATQGQVLIRSGSQNKAATVDEITALEHRAAAFQVARAGIA